MLAFELQFFRPEIQEQPDINSRRGQVVYELDFVDCNQGMDSLVLDQDGTFDQQVRNELAHDDVFLAYLNPGSAFDMQPSLPQFED